MVQVVRTKFDHIGIAVPDWASAEQYWRDLLGGGRVAWEEHEEHRGLQLRYANGAKLELLSPPERASDGFVVRFLERFGSTVHHLTLKVNDVAAAAEIVGRACYDVVDLDVDGATWHEAYLRPSQTGGVLIQVAWSSHEDDRAWAASSTGVAPEPVAADAASLVGVSLVHTDLYAAARLWTLLGAEVREVGVGLLCSWPGSPLTVDIERGDRCGPVALRMTGREDAYAACPLRLPVRAAATAGSVAAR